MNPRILIAAVMASAATLSGTTWAQGYNPAADGLVPVHSRQLDELYVRPDAKFAAYRKVIIDEARVGFHKEWLKYMYPLDATRPVGADHAKRIAAQIALDARTNIVEAFQARGYEIVTAPGPDVLRLSPGVAELYVNAPDRFTPSRDRSFTREAGQATLLLDVRDSSSGTLLARVAHQGTADQMGRLARADDVANRFWFDSLSRKWAKHCAAQLSGT